MTRTAKTQQKAIEQTKVINVILQKEVIQKLNATHD